MKCLSLFANVGIGETYFKDIGIDVVVANELEIDRAEFYKKMHPDCVMIGGVEYRQFPDATREKERNLGADITDPTIFSEIISESKKAGVEFIMATPPCQGMSIAHAKRAEKNDSRNSLIRQVVRATKELKPKYVLVENVRGMASEKTFILDDDGKEVNIMPYIESLLGDEYNISYKVLDASDFQTPHYRDRLITLMSRKDQPQWRHPKPNEAIAKYTVRHVIGHLPSLECGQSSAIKWHSLEFKKPAARHVKWMMHTPTGQSAFDNEIWCPCFVEEDVKVPGYEDKISLPRKIKGFKSTYRRIEWDRPAPTVTMMNGSINSQNNVHPGREKDDGTFSDARVLTIKELCAIIGLPLGWVDHLEHTQQRENFLRRVLGECFPPMMAKAIVNNIPKQKEMSYGNTTENAIRC